MTPAQIRALAAEQARLEPALEVLLGTVARWAGLSVAEPATGGPEPAKAPAADSSGAPPPADPGWTPGLPAPRSAQTSQPSAPPPLTAAPDRGPAATPQAPPPGAAFPLQAEDAQASAPRPEAAPESMPRPALARRERAADGPPPQPPRRDPAAAPLAQLRRIATRGKGGTEATPARDRAPLAIAASPAAIPQTTDRPAPAPPVRRAPAAGPTAAGFPTTPAPGVPAVAVPAPDRAAAAGAPADAPAPPPAATAPATQPWHRPTPAATVTPAPHAPTGPARPDPFAPSKLEEDLADALARAAREAGIDLT